MRRPRVLLLAGLLPLAACTSFAGTGPAADTSSSSPSSSSSSAAASPSDGEAGGELTVTAEADLGTASDTVTAARVVVDADGTPSTLMGGARSATIRTGGDATLTQGTLVADLVATADGPLAVTLTADAVGTDPVLGLLPAPATVPSGAPNGNGVPVEPVELSPRQTAPRGLPVFAALSPDGDVLYVLAESSDDGGAEVFAVDPVTGQLQDSAEVDTGFTDVTALALGGLAVTGDGELVVGLTLDTGDPLAADGTAAPLLRLDNDLRPSGQPADAQDGPGRTTVLAVSTDAEGEPLALVSDAQRGLRVVDPDLDAGTATTREVLADGSTRAGALAVDGGTAVVTLLDRTRPTVAVLPPGGSTADTLELCDGAGDALDVAAVEDGFLVVGTCEGTTRLWTLG